MSAQPISKKRLDYKAPAFLIDTVELTFDLHRTQTKVQSKLSVRRVAQPNDNTDKVLELDGENLNFVSLLINDVPAVEGQDFSVNETSMSVFTDLPEFTLCITNTINPKQNTSLEGLYFSNNAYCTQCEAEGFRKITYFLDRPDILSKYLVTIHSYEPSQTYLLSNGNKLSDTGFENGKRTCVWQDPFPKPCYLFALVAGHFDKLDDTFETQSGRKIDLQLFVDEGRLGQGQHALDSLKKAMRWDEQTYGLEYDLDIYMIVAVDFFNMGAMENKGLNVFNSKYVLAEPDKATDEDYFNIEAVIAHEYFHNWTGNRVTCRDWFQLSLKEGLTVFRDQQFSAQMFSPLVTRIDQVKLMREHQFAEDAGPMKHPIRPDEVMEMNNFYTVTVYDKGAEVIRMLHTFLGKAGFRSGMDEYFARHDGQAVTCDDFVNAMQGANDIDLSQFKRWYEQAGTPIIKVAKHFEKNIDDALGTLRLSFSQQNPAMPENGEMTPLFIPIKLAFYSADGKKVNGSQIDTNLKDDTFVLSDCDAEIVIHDVDESLTPSLLQDFSAPVKIEYDYSSDALVIIIQHADNHYAKWEATQQLYQLFIVKIYKALQSGEFEQPLAAQKKLVAQDIEQLSHILQSITVPNEVLAKMLTLPSVESLIANTKGVDPILMNDCQKTVTAAIALHMQQFCHASYTALVDKSAQQTYQYERTQVNDRQLQNTCLLLLAATGSESYCALIEKQYKQSNSMTNRLGALKAASILSQDLFTQLMGLFETQFTKDAVVMDKWFALHGNNERSDILAHLDLLQAHSQYSIKNPNKVRSLVGSFAFYNTSGFHQKSGAGYKFLADYLIKLDPLNPQVASRLITPFIQYKNYAQEHSDLMKSQLARLFTTKGLSKDLFEKISKALSDE